MTAGDDAERQEVVIEVGDVVVRRGGRDVVQGLSFSIRAGEVVGLLGPSGSGKSSLIRALAGVQAQVSGVVEVLGLRAGTAQLRTQVGYVTQAPSVYTDLTIRENLTYFATIVGATDEQVSRVLARVRLADIADASVGTLSGGQLSRVSLAVALLANPSVLLLDEPTVGLDPVLRRDLWADFRQLADEGAAVLVSSHVMDEAVRCDRLLLLRDGHLLADTTPIKLLEDTGAADADEAFLVLIEGGRR